MNPPLQSGYQRESAHGQRVSHSEVANYPTRGIVLIRPRATASDPVPVLQYRYPSPSRRPDLPQIRPHPFLRRSAAYQAGTIRFGLPRVVEVAPDQCCGHTHKGELTCEVRSLHFCSARRWSWRPVAIRISSAASPAQPSGASAQRSWAETPLPVRLSAERPACSATTSRRSFVADATAATDVCVNSGQPVCNRLAFFMQQGGGTAPEDLAKGRRCSRKS